MSDSLPSHGTLPQRVALPSRVAAFRAATQDFLSVAEGLSEADLDRQPPQPDGWTPRMVIHHVADAETTAYVRLRKLLAEPAGTTIQAYDEAQWARALHYDRPVAADLAVFRAVRESSAELLDRITDADLARAGVHTEAGRYTLEDWLATYVEHAHVHAAQIRETTGGGW